MADEPKKETVRIELPPPPQPPAAKPPNPNTKSRETVRIQLPVRQPSDTAPLRVPTGPSPASKPADQGLLSRQFFQSPPLSSVSPPKSPPVSMPVPSPPAASVSSAPNLPSSVLKKETARIPRMPDLPSQPLPTVQMKKTQPLIAMPLTAPQSASIAVAPTEERATPLCWVLLGVSAVILIIQIWTYLS
ncbi:MAG: hypothetical protein DME75_02565 [Verrucomicrobia bacterium]|nr:MAG: hypothetical protein DME75_02565 [Verrucomicrobiota bacterium]